MRRLLPYLTGLFPGLNARARMLYRTLAKGRDRHAYREFVAWTLLSGTIMLGVSLWATFVTGWESFPILLVIGLLPFLELFNLAAAIFALVTTANTNSSEMFHLVGLTNLSHADRRKGFTALAWISLRVPIALFVGAAAGGTTGIALASLATFGVQSLPALLTYPLFLAWSVGTLLFIIYTNLEIGVNNALRYGLTIATVATTLFVSAILLPGALLVFGSGMLMVFLLLTSMLALAVG
ncbi:MAG: hypothetical protein GYB68_13630 [Chloroflexi bacterium]|nr:hypothetical protein [Chloroflexota bacterium]